MDKKIRTPIEIMIDAACGSPPGPRVLSAEEKEAAARVANATIYHIDTMYPDMWKGVPKTARTSVRNTISGEVERLLRNQPKP